MKLWVAWCGRNVWTRWVASKHPAPCNIVRKETGLDVKRQLTPDGPPPATVPAAEAACHASLFCWKWFIEIIFRLRVSLQLNSIHSSLLSTFRQSRNNGSLLSRLLHHSLRRSYCQYFYLKAVNRVQKRSSFFLRHESGDVCYSVVHVLGKWFLCFFWRVKLTCEKRLLPSSCLSFGPDVTSRLPLNGFYKIWYSNINSQPDETITNFIDNYNQLNMFRAIISPIIRSTRLCLQLVVSSTDDAACWQYRRCIIPQVVNTV